MPHHAEIPKVEEILEAIETATDNLNKWFDAEAASDELEVA